jgi:hypothetical protein
VLGKERQVTVRLGPETKIVVSTRDEHPEDLEHLFKTSPVTAADIKPGNCVVVELSGRPKAPADSVTVTLQKAPAR